MPEGKEDMVEQGQKGGEIDTRDDLGSQHRDIDKFVGERRKARMRGPRAITRSDVDESWRTRGEPGPQPSQKPWNTEIVRPDKSGKYR